MSARLRERLVERIRARGPITFAEYMEAALYDPEDGFFARARVGADRDFVTSPHVSPVFGRLILRQLVEAWRLMEADPFTVVEIGSGSGALAMQITTFAAEEPAFATALRYVAVEQSAAAREALRTRGIETHATPADAIPEPVTGCVLANELLDNLPFHRLRGARSGHTVEVYVGAEDDRLIEIEAPPSSEALAAASAPPHEDEDRPVSPRALDLVRSLRHILARGYVFLFDYGFVGGENPEPIRGYRAHRLEHDLLADPGSADITGPVDFDAVTRAAEESGFTVWGPVTQRDALMALGYRATAETMRHKQSDAETANDWRQAIQTFGDRGQAAMLVDPAGLGSLRLLVLGTPGLSEPAAVRSPQRVRDLR